MKPIRPWVLIIGFVLFVVGFGKVVVEYGVIVALILAALASVGLYKWLKESNE